MKLRRKAKYTLDERRRLNRYVIWPQRKINRLIIKYDRMFLYHVFNGAVITKEHTDKVELLDHRRFVINKNYCKEIKFSELINKFRNNG